MHLKVSEKQGLLEWDANSTLLIFAFVRNQSTICQFGPLLHFCDLARNLVNLGGTQGNLVNIKL